MHYLQRQKIRKPRVRLSINHKSSNHRRKCVRAADFETQPQSHRRQLRLLNVKRNRLRTKSKHYQKRTRQHHATKKGDVRAFQPDSQPMRENIITSSTLKEKIAKAIDGEQAKYADATKTKVDNLLKEAIGENGEELKNTVEKSLEELTTPKSAVGGNGDRQLKVITAPQEIADSETYYSVRSFTAEKEEKKKNQAGSSCPSKADKPADPPKSADECKKHLTEKPCKDEKGCDFDDKKPEGERCFPKAGTDKKDEKSSYENLRVFVPQVFSALVLVEF
uniref:Variant surface glycoprotein 1125.3171 n=1 Tax=Trypanosoma brucei TaxID=5691 RepID=A0A1J0R9Y1_9TRYP|nr:variant surface glycoprotein 1125.3171 [Trypanosoma brucei]